jgi:hypothetical protein
MNRGDELGLRQTYCTGGRKDTLWGDMEPCRVCVQLNDRLAEPGFTRASSEEYAARQRADEAELTERDRLDHALGHFDDFEFRPGHYHRNGLNPCGRWQCLYCHIQRIKFSDKFIAELLRDEGREEKKPKPVTWRHPRPGWPEGGQECLSEDSSE